VTSDLHTSCVMCNPFLHRSSASKKYFLLLSVCSTDTVCCKFVFVGFHLQVGMRHCAVGRRKRNIQWHLLMCFDNVSLTLTQYCAVCTLEDCAVLQSL